MTNNPEVAEFTENFPTSLYMLKKKFGILDDKFTKYVLSAILSMSTRSASP